MSANDELKLPKATVTKIIKELLPKDLRCSTETRDLLAECGQEFVKMIASQANEVCNKEGKKTMGPNHVMTALKELDFGSYVDSVNEFHTQHLQDEKERPRYANKMSTSSGISQEEKIRQQQELFALARAKSRELDNSGASAASLSSLSNTNNNNAAVAPAVAPAANFAAAAAPSFSLGPSPFSFAPAAPPS